MFKSFKMYTLSSFMCNLILVIILLSFTGTMLLCAYNSAYEIVIALASILVAIISSAIFNVRAEIAKQQQIMSLEKRHIAYQEVCIALNSFIGPLRVLSLSDILGKSIIVENIITYHRKENEFCQNYNKNSFLFSEDIIEQIRGLCRITYDISQNLTVLTCKDKKLQDMIKKAIEAEKDIRELIRKELKLS